MFKKKDKPRKKQIILSNPIKGEIIKLEKVPDEVFAQNMLGDGFAIFPLEGLLYSPVDGEIKMLFPTFHALTIETKQGLDIMIHIGIDTVELEGRGFTPLVKPGDKVKRGDLMIIFDIETIKEKLKSPITPVIITNMNIVKSLKVKYGNKDIEDEILTVELK